MARQALFRRPVWLVVLAAGCAASGCASRATERQTVRLVASARPYERDIPLPAGFKLVDAASEDRSTGVNRLYLRHLYVGRADKYAVRNFYREQMPLARWSLVSDGNVRGVCTLRFEKKNESCTIVIRDASKGLNGNVEVEVLASQEQRGSREVDPDKLRNTP